MPRPVADGARIALVYRGPASIPGCPEAVFEALERSRWDLDVRFIGPQEALRLDPDVLSTPLLYAQPGGIDLRRAYRKVARHAPAIRRFVRSGGRYLGFCLGGYLAGETPGFGLLPGDAERYISTPDARPDHPGDAVATISWGGNRRRVFFEDGPWFRLDPARGAAHALATYANGLPAAVVATFGRGAVGVVGPHPEATPAWFADSGLEQPDDLPRDLCQDLIDRTMTLGREQRR